MAVAAGWPTIGGNGQHTGISTTPAQPLAGIRWTTPVDVSDPPEANLIHYGSPVVTPANTVVIPIRTTGGFRLDARTGAAGFPLWTTATDYRLPPHTWVPSYQPTLDTNGRVYFAGAGGTVLFRDNLDAAVPATSGRLAFYGLAQHAADPASFDGAVFVNTPITVDASGTLYFGFRATAGAPLGLASGIARIDAEGNGSWVSAQSLSGDAAATQVPHQAAPALASDGSTLYVVVAGPSASPAFLVGLDPSTLAVRESAPGAAMRRRLTDPRNGAVNDASVLDESSASPTVGPDGDVYYGVMGNPGNGSRGWLLHFSADLSEAKTPGGFGWDNTPAVVPASAAPSYAGTSPYLVFSKYNDYAGFDGGQGVNRIALLDPNDTMPELHASSNGLPVMKIVMAIAGPTADAPLLATYPNAVKEWCINAAAVDPVTKAVFANSEDGRLYRWDLATNTLSQAVTLSPGVFEAYTPTAIGPEGAVYAINAAILNAVGTTPAGSLDVDGNGGADALTDGLLVLRYLFGIAGDPLVANALGAGATRTTPAQVVAHLDATRARFDVDGDGAVDALTDGLLVIRYLFGLRDMALIAGAVAGGATRTTPEAIAAYIETLLP